MSDFRKRTQGQTPASRGKRAREVAGFDRQTADRLSLETTDETEELAVRVPDVERAYPEGVDTELTGQQARLLSQARSRPKDENRAARVASVARKHAGADLSASTYVGSFMPLFEELVTEALSGVAAGTETEVEAVRADLLAGIRSAMVDMQVGVAEFDDADVTPLAAEEYGEELTTEELVDSIPHPSYVIDDDNTMLAYNVGQDRLLGLADGHREFLGGDCRDTLAAATYTDGSRHYTLADKVAENPRDADEEWDVERVDQDNEYTDHLVYEDSSVSTNTDGEETHIEFVAVPIFADDGSLKAVFELTQDRTEAVHYQQSVSEMVDEVSETLTAIGDGDLSARVSYDDGRDVLEQELLTMTAEVDEMAENFQSLVTRVSEKTTELEASIERATGSARDIDGMVDSQRSSLEQVAEEMAEFSAMMEEVAATSDEVAEAAETALSEAERGAGASQDAQAVVAEVRSMSDDLVETVERLNDYMDEIGAFADVIADVADQTNILALNANIEAARAGEDGQGFAVVADEVKQLATETQEHAEEITDRIETVQRQTDETVSEVEHSHDRIQDAEAEIAAATDALGTITETVEDAAAGIREVADANDEQAATIEEVTATVDSARDEATEVAETTKDVVAEAEAQERAVGELADRVRELSTTDSE